MAKNKSAAPPTTRELIAETVGGQDYMVRPVKGYVGIILADSLQKAETDMPEFRKGIETLIDAIFTKNDAKKIRARLLNPDDDLDLPEVMECFTRLVAKTTGNPTT